VSLQELVTGTKALCKAEGLLLDQQSDRSVAMTRLQVFRPISPTHYSTWLHSV